MKKTLFAKPNPYHIQKVLGDSPLSLVCLAYREDDILKLKHPIVLKIFKNKDHSFLPTLQMESLLRTQHNPFLVKVLSLEWLEGKATLVLEYIKGLSLKQLLKYTELNKQESAYICHNIQCGLKELRQNGLSHGDLSLSNILLDIKANVLLSDYGLANYEGDSFYATPPFSAPELSPLLPPCLYSDLFSLGVIEKVLHHPFRENELFEMCSEHFMAPNDPLLDPVASKRKFKTFSFSADTQIKLSAKVQHSVFLQDCTPSSSPALYYFPKKEKEQKLRKLFLNQRVLLKSYFRRCLLYYRKAKAHKIASLKPMCKKLLSSIKSYLLYPLSLLKKNSSQLFIYLKTFPIKFRLTAKLLALKKECMHLFTKGKGQIKFLRTHLFKKIWLYMYSIKNFFTPYFCSLLGLCFLFFLLSINPFVSYGNYELDRELSKAYILVRTQKWVQIEFSNFKAYSPLQFQLSPIPVSGRLVNLKWRTLNESGEKQIHLKRGQSLLLSDKDFNQ